MLFLTLIYHAVSVRKVWNDNNNATKVRPESIVMVLSNGTAVLLNEENGWAATIDNLPTKINGEPAEYTWTEQTVIGYRLDRVEQEEDVTVFTNTLIVPPETGEGKEPKKPTGTFGVFEEYDTALGLETIINHVGDCFD